MGAEGLPRINEITAFLESHAPDRIVSLVGKPLTAELLAPGVHGGEPDAASGPDVRAGLAARAEVLAVALDVAIARCGPAVESIAVRLRKARRWRFTSLSLATIGASSVIGTAFTSATAALVAGLFTLIANIAALFTDQVVLGGQFKEADLAATAQKLTKAKGMAQLTKDLLGAVAKTDFEIGEMRVLLQQSNALFEEINDALPASA